MHKQSLIHKLFEIGAVQFGSFTLKSGQISPFYIDLRRAFSYPKILVAMAEAMFTEANNTSLDLVCGVPYAAIPLATAIAIDHTLPLIFLRKEKKGHGTKKMIEGVYEKGARVLLIEDVITSGQSILESVAPLQEEGLIVEEIVIFADRQQGGMDNLAKAGYRARSVCTVTELVKTLLEEKLIEQATVERVYAFLKT